MRPAAGPCGAVRVALCVATALASGPGLVLPRSRCTRGESCRWSLFSFRRKLCLFVTGAGGGRRPDEAKAAPAGDWWGRAGGAAGLSARGSASARGAGTGKGGGAGDGVRGLPRPGASAGPAPPLVRCGCSLGSHPRKLLGWKKGQTASQTFPEADTSSGSASGGGEKPTTGSADAQSRPTTHWASSWVRAQRIG